MAYEVFANDLNPPSSTLAVAVTTVGQTTVQPTDATKFSTIPNFRIRLGDELMLVTAIAAGVFTVTRGIEGTTASTYAVGTNINQLPTAESLRQIQQNRPQFTNTSSVVYTIDVTNSNLPDVAIWHNRAGNTSYVLPSPTQGRHIEWNDQTQAIGASANWCSFVPSAGEKINGSTGFALTGTNFHFTNGSANVSCTGGAFTKELYIGASIASSNQSTVNYIVQSITDDNNLVLRTTFSGSTTTTATAKRTSLLIAANGVKMSIDSDGTDWIIAGDGTPTIIEFTTVGAITFIPPAGVNAYDAELCGGGGGGGSGGGCAVAAGATCGGGGAAGGGAQLVSRRQVSCTGNTALSGTVGDGGTGGTAVSTNVSGNPGSGGQASTLDTIKALGGSGGGIGGASGTANVGPGGAPYTTSALANNTTTTSNVYQSNSLTTTRGAALASASQLAAPTATSYLTTLGTTPIGGLPGGGGDGGESNVGAAISGIVGNPSTTGQAGGAAGAGGTTNTNPGGSGGGGGGGGAFGAGAAGGAGANGTASGTPATATSGSAGAANTGAGGGGGGAAGSGASTLGTSGAGGKGGSGKVRAIYVL